MANEFSEVSVKLPIEQQAVFSGLTRRNNPRGGADFIATGSPNTIPLLFSLLVSEDTSLEGKMSALANVRGALVDPAASGLSTKVPGDPERFFNNLVNKSTRDTLEFPPTERAQEYLQAMLANFQVQMTRSPAVTLAGENPNIFRIDNLPVDENYLLETVIIGTLSKDLPENFRQTLLRTLLFVGSKNPNILTHSIINIPNLVPEIMGTETARERQIREAKERQETFNLLQSELIEAQKARDRIVGELNRTRQELGNKEREINILNELLARARAQRPGAAQEAARATRSPFEVLGVTTNATGPEILRAYRELLANYHPDMIMGILERAEVPPGRRKGFEEMANERTKEINNAFDRLRQMGKVT